MAYGFFKIPCDDAGGAAEALNGFIASRRIVHVSRQWVEAGGESFWAFCIEYREGGTATPSERGFGKIDYREVLPPAQFAIFTKLRKLREAMADKEGVPAFAVFTNEQMAEIVRRECKTLEDLKGIPGIGVSRVEKYGPGVLDAMRPVKEERGPVPP